MAFGDVTIMWLRMISSSAGSFSHFEQLAEKAVSLHGPYIGTLISEQFQNLVNI